MPDTTSRKRRALIAAAGLTGGVAVLTAVGVIAAGGLTVQATQAAAGGSAIGSCLADDSAITVDPVFTGGNTSEFASVRLRITSSTSAPTCGTGFATVNLGTAGAAVAYYASGSITANGDIDLTLITRDNQTTNPAPMTTTDWTTFSVNITGGTAQSTTRP